MAPAAASRQPHRVPVKGLFKGSIRVTTRAL